MRRRVVRRRLRYAHYYDLGAPDRVMFGPRYSFWLRAEWPWVLRSMNPKPWRLMNPHRRKRLG